MSITLREPVLRKIVMLQEKEHRAATSEMVTALVEESLDAREKKAERK